jgi:BirA family biotin operon repressor/biotin-[acetyl-CoA-carboxylase] ligase
VTFAAGWPEGVGLRRYDVLDSTNEEARRLALAGERGPLWITAAEQIMGRGRLQRVWVSNRGNLFATLLMEGAPPHSCEIGFVAAIAVVDSAERYLARGAARLKWPNDVLIFRRKLAGILIEQLAPGVIAAGIGINLVHCPDGAASIHSVCGFAPQPGEMLNVIAVEMHAWLTLWRAHGFAHIREAWIARADGIGEPISASTGPERLQGVFEDIDPDGALVLRDGAGKAHRVTAADVYYGL